MDKFWGGFTKEAYNYNQETRELKSKYTAKSKEKPMDPKKSATGFGIAGGLAGGIYGGIGAMTSLKPGGMNTLAGAGIGGLAGAALGVMLGLASAHGHKESILQAKKILKMAPKKQMDLLRSEAREREGHDNRHEQARLNAQYNKRDY